VRKLYTLFFTSVLLTFTGCEDKKTDKNNIPIENTTEFYGTETAEGQNDTRFKVVKKKTSTVQEPVSFSDTFTLYDMKQTTYVAHVSDKKVTFKENDKAIKLITFFASWCPPCVHDIPYMNDLQKKYRKEMLLLGVLIHDDITKPALKSFLAKHEVNYFISTSTHNNDFASLIAKTLSLPKNFSIPLTVMYVKGEYFTHYEGAVPIEMIEYDINQALKTIK